MNIYLTTSLPSYIDNWTQNVILNSKFFKSLSDNWFVCNSDRLLLRAFLHPGDPKDQYSINFAIKPHRRVEYKIYKVTFMTGDVMDCKFICKGYIQPNPESFPDIPDYVQVICDNLGISLNEDVGTSLVLVFTLDEEIYKMYTIAPREKKIYSTCIERDALDLELSHIKEKYLKHYPKYKYVLIPIDNLELSIYYMLNFARKNHYSVIAYNQGDKS